MITFFRQRSNINGILKLIHASLSKFRLTAAYALNYTPNACSIICYRQSVKRLGPGSVLSVVSIFFNSLLRACSKRHRS